MCTSGCKSWELRIKIKDVKVKYSYIMGDVLRVKVNKKKVGESADDIRIDK